MYQCYLCVLLHNINLRSFTVSGHVKFELDVWVAGRVLCPSGVGAWPMAVHHVCG